ncbi:MAG: 50S ribosomal protein L28 [Clostridia bacterium]
MAKCEICSKDVTYSLQVSHSNRKTARTYKPNIQTVRVNAGGNTTKKVNVCARCLKSGKVQRAI